MRILITGAAGMIGRKLTARLAADGTVAGQPLGKVVLHDIIEATTPAGLDAIVATGDLAQPGVPEALIAEHRPELIFHLAGIVSAEAEANFDLGYRVNLDGTRALLDAIRTSGSTPRVVFASTIAVYGAPFPDIIPDDFHLTPKSSYGTQKMMAEALLADYARRGFLDGVGIRLPTICVRPGKPNKAASSFFSGIIREPLAGQRANLPVPRDVLHTHASPRSAVGFLLHAAGLDTSQLEGRPNLTMPGVACTVGEQIEALRRVAGDAVAARIDEVPDPVTWAIVKNWPTRFAATRARALGFTAETSFDDIIRIHIDEDLGGIIPA